MNNKVQVTKVLGHNVSNWKTPGNRGDLSYLKIDDQTIVTVYQSNDNEEYSIVFNGMGGLFHNYYITMFSIDEVFPTLESGKQRVNDFLNKLNNLKVFL
jgi:hypothetical protein